ncbi:MAG: hypothetical protein LBO66_07380 [Deltaproteobacteria bacterium]|jgi:hypothetical protein|nr:hypothetical protein [Deltaproteobacteria bacterium]
MSYNPPPTLPNLPTLLFQEWIHVTIPGASFEANYPLPPECADYFTDYAYPPNIQFFAKAALESAARYLNSSDSEEFKAIRPAKKDFPTLPKQIREWTRLMEAWQINRAEKKSRLIKYQGSDKCSIGYFWNKHDDWPDWPTVWPDRFIQGTSDGDKWLRWSKERRVKLTLVRSSES